MESPPSLDSDLPTLSIFALEASIALYSTTKRYQLPPKNARDLSKDIETLIDSLSPLREVISTFADTDFAVLKFPLLRCGTACNEFEQEIQKCLPFSDDGNSDHRGWAKLKYIGGGINDFKDLLSGYGSTFRLALADVHLRSQSSLDVDNLKDHKDQIKIAKADLELHLGGFDEMAELILDTDASGLQQHQEQRRSMEMCLHICTQLSDNADELEAKQKEAGCWDPATRSNRHRNENTSNIDITSTGDAVVFMVSTDGSVINGNVRATGWRTRHVGGHLNDASVRQISRDFTTMNTHCPGNKATHTQSDASSTAENKSVKFLERYGPGLTTSQSSRT
ncbi:hypothetical protein BJX63DRAFT_438159 [Aspergillus granulosus]|uniref:Azaphilone pigments biosynthesis cluster protein L N-terminal domain-containing protein n=1 Tax=Aspergillus granulosus TaxID=176169 RepID=A0ABR4GSX1_9EURO